MCSVSMNHNTRSWKSQTITCRWQAGRLICRTGGESAAPGQIGWFLLPQRLEHEEGVGQHHQGQMPMQPLPGSPLVVTEATFTFGILIELLDGPPQMGQLHQARQGGSAGKLLKNHLGLPSSPARGRSASSHPSGPVQLRPCVWLWRAQPVPAWTRRATNCLHRAPLVPSRHWTVCHISSGKESVTAFAS